MVPKDWELATIGEMFDFKNGLNADKERYGHGVKFVNVMDIFRSDRLFEDGIAGRVSINEKELNVYGLKFGDVLFNRTSETFDEIAMSAVYLDHKPAVFGGFVIRGRPKTKKVYPQYSVYLFQASSFRKAAISKGQGAVRANIGQKELSEIRQLIPPVLEQKKIAKILSTWDEAIATTEQLLANSEQQKKALMQQLLTGKRRLPGFEGEKWKKIKVGEMFDPSKEKAGDSPFEVYSVTKSGLVSQEEYFKKSVSSEDKTSYKVVRKGYFVMSGLNFWMGSVDVHVEQKNVIVSPAYKVYQISDGFDVGFVRHFVRSQGFMKVLVGSSLTGASIVRRNFSGTIFNNWPLEMPGKEEQEEIAKVIDCAEREVDLLAADLDRLKEEKKALMQQLLTGKRRVKVDEPEQATA